MPWWVPACIGGGAAVLVLAAALARLPVRAAERAAASGPAASANADLKVRSVRFLEAPPASPMKMPSDAAVGVDGSLYVLDGVHDRVVVFDPGGTYSYEFGRRGDGPGEFKRPLGIETGSDGRVYIADSGNGRIQILTAKGEPVGAFPLPTGPEDVAADPTGVALDEDRDRLYVADNDNHRIVLFDMAERGFDGVWGGPGRGPRQFRFPFHIDTTADGYLLVVEVINTRVQALSPEGKFVGFLGSWGVRPGQLFRPKGVAVLSDRVLVTEGYLGRIQVLDLRGRSYGLLAGPRGEPLKLTTPTGIAVDAERGRIYVVELKTNRVCRLDLEGP